MKLSAFDRFTLSLAPKWTLDRLKSRQAAETYARHYEAAATGRRTANWARPTGDANSVIGLAASELRLQARDLIRNNAWAKRAQRVIANNVVGWGIVPKASGPKPAVNLKAQALWKAWAGTTSCETESRHTFYGLQSLVIKAVAESGECLLRRRWRRPEDNLPLPFQVQVLEADFLDTSKDHLIGNLGGPIIQGIEFDQIGRRVAYWLFPEHPGSNLAAGVPSNRIPAEDVAHVFYAERPGQTRGVSWYGASIVNLRDLHEYDDAELMKQKIAACFAAFVTDTDGSASPLGEQSTTDEMVETFEPGMIHQLPVGKEVTFGTPPQPTTDSFPTRNLRRIAAGIGIPYEELTGDYSQVNFSSARMSRIAHQGNIRDWQGNMLIPLLCDAVWKWAMEAAIAIGELPEAPPSEWTAPPLPMIDPAAEGLAYSRLVRNGVMTYSEMVREQGGDPDAHWIEYAEDQKKLDALGILLDSDVRAVSAAGLTQVRAGVQSGAPPAEPPPPAPADAQNDFEVDISVETFERFHQ